MNNEQTFQFKETLPQCLAPGNPTGDIQVKDTDNKV